MFLSRTLRNALEHCFRRDLLGTVEQKDYNKVANRLTVAGLDVESQPATKENIEKVVEFAEDYADELYSMKED